MGVSRKQSTPNFPKQNYFLPPDTHKYVNSVKPDRYRFHTSQMTKRINRLIMPDFQIVQRIFCTSKKKDQTNLDEGTSNGTHEASIKRFTKFIRDLRDLINHVDYVGLDLIMQVF